MSEEGKAATPDDKQPKAASARTRSTGRSKSAPKASATKSPDKSTTEAKESTAAKADAVAAGAASDTVKASAPADQAPAASKDKPTGKPEATAPDKTSDKPAKPASSGRGAVVLALVLFALLLAALAGASWYGWTLIQADQAALAQVKSQQTGAQTDLDQRLSSVHQQVSQLGDQLDQQDQSLKAKDAATDQRVSHLSKQFAQLSDRLGRGDLAWHIAEIGSLLTRAQERLVVSRDPHGALVALDLADQRLAALDRPELLPVRSAISDVREALSKVQGVDRIGMALHLRRAADSVSNWPLKGMKAKPNSNAAPAAPATDVSQPAAADQPWYRRAWHATTAWFARQFTVTRSDEPVKANARATTDRETRLWLTAVRESLLARDVAGVGAAVTQAKEWIDGHYAVDAAPVADALKALDEARRLYADQPWPSMTKVFKVWNASGLNTPQKIAKDGFKKPAGNDGTGGAQ